METAIFWIAGNLILPLFPVLVSVVVLKVAGRPLGVHAVLEDGVLFFYTATISIVFLFDIFKWRETTRSDASDWNSILVALSYIIGVVFTFLAIFGYAIAALGKAGIKDVNGRVVALSWLSSSSWQLAIVGIICNVTARFALTIF